MSMVHVNCPYCRKDLGSYAVNPKASRSQTIANCKHCHKPIYIIKENGKAKAIKR